MKAVLLAAGFGSRLLPITKSIPKCMVSINGRPLLDYWMEILGESEEITSIIINTHHLPEPVRIYTLKSKYLDKIELIHEENLLGTAGTLQAVMSTVDNDDILVAHADNLTLFDLNQFIDCYRHRPAVCKATMMVFRTDDPKSCGIVKVDTEGIVKEFYEKVQNPPGNLANGAVYIFNQAALSVLTHLDKDGVKEISIDLIPKLIGAINVFHNSSYHRDIGNPTALSQSLHEFPAIYQKFKSKR
jgi:mannose-1-phosphate guanylyltransferase